jgi:hypothetical protein
MGTPRASGRPPHVRRQQAQKARRARRIVLVGIVVVAFLVTVMFAAFGSSPSPVRAPIAASSAALLPAGPPKPEIVAVYGSCPVCVQIQLPIAQRDVTALGYHGAGGDALALQPLGRQKNEGFFSRLAHRIFGGGGGGRLTWYQLGGGTGPSTGALDVGAAPGTDVYSPVKGTIVSLQDYVVNGKVFGNTIAIQPAVDPSVVVVLDHLRADPSLTVGAPVSAGTVKLGTVIDFSGVERQALARHTQDAGNHVTVMVQPAATVELR